MGAICNGRRGCARQRRHDERLHVLTVHDAFVCGNAISFRCPSWFCYMPSVSKQLVKASYYQIKGSRRVTDELRSAFRMNASCIGSCRGTVINHNMLTPSSVVVFAMRGTSTWYNYRSFYLLHAMHDVLRCKPILAGPVYRAGGATGGSRMWPSDLGAHYSPLPRCLRR